MGIEIKDALEIYTDGEGIIFKKYEPACIFCGEAKNTKNYKGKIMCQHCIDEIKGSAMSKKVYPECKSSMSYSKWLKIWHCDNMECTVYIDETGRRPPQVNSFGGHREKGTSWSKSINTTGAHWL